MGSPARPRLHTLLLVLLLVALGLGSRRPELPRFVIFYAGDVLWGTFFYFSFAVVRPRAVRAWLFAAALFSTELIELSQLYHAPWIDHFRDTRIGGLLLGHDFSWHDVICVAVGSALGVSLDLGLAAPSRHAGCFASRRRPTGAKHHGQ